MQLLVGELRQGALEGILMDAVARASGPGGFALRFARVKRYRTDKTAAETDTFATVESMYRDQTPANRTPGV